MHNRIAIRAVSCIAFLVTSTFGCGRSPEAESRSRLKTTGFRFYTADSRTPIVTIPRTPDGRTIVSAANGFNHLNDDDLKRAIEDLRKLPELDTLDLDQTMITNEALRDVATLQSLRHLSLRTTNISDEGIAFLAPHRNLEGLYFESSQGITGKGFSSLHGESLRQLSLRATMFTDESASMLKRFPSMQHLDLGLCVIGDETIRVVATMTWLNSLLIDRSNVTDNGIAELLKCRFLERVVLCQCLQVKNAENIRKMCQLPNLLMIDLRGTAIHNEEIDAIRSEFPHVTVQWSFDGGEELRGEKGGRSSLELFDLAR